jgi:hypothetical protein
VEKSFARTFLVMKEGDLFSQKESVTDNASVVQQASSIVSRRSVKLLDKTIASIIV